jgi:hypothetical protein
MWLMTFELRIFRGMWSFTEFTKNLDDSVDSADFNLIY